ncbi:MAG: phosphotransferase [Candidatus Accumulibacter sp.]|jgi:hypothetical protein|nr:phosphotransferase [Accumulibacter sp.]
MRIVTAQELEHWLKSGEVLEHDTRGPKVVALKNAPDALEAVFLKIFHTRRRPWLARLFPAAARFAKNTGILKKAGIPAPEVVETFWIDPSAGLSACLYRPLPGCTLEALLQRDPSEIDALLPKLAGFIRRLHRHRIYFRSLHTGNLVLMPDGNFGLIDVLDLKQLTLPLGPWRVRRNFRHMKHRLDRENQTAFPFEELLRLYREGGKEKSESL